MLRQLTRAAPLRAALRAARPAARSLSVTARALSDDHGPKEPIIVGKGAPAGAIPTNQEQATGLERLQVLGEMEGYDFFDMDPLYINRLGTKKDPIMVKSYGVRPRHQPASAALTLCSTASASSAALATPSTRTRFSGSTATTSASTGARSAVAVRRTILFRLLQRTEVCVQRSSSTSAFHAQRRTTRAALYHPTNVVLESSNSLSFRTSTFTFLRQCVCASPPATCYWRIQHGSRRTVWTAPRTLTTQADIMNRKDVSCTTLHLPWRRGSSAAATPCRRAFCARHTVECGCAADVPRSL